jgi:hydroxymethylpyrimidine pyrophosphatase-like HAD family hydrolase
MIKLVLSDMDGIFLNNSGDFNRELYKNVKKIMKEKGVVFAPVTGKQCERIEELFGDDTDGTYSLLAIASNISIPFSTQSCLKSCSSSDSPIISHCS